MPQVFEGSCGETTATIHAFHCPPTLRPSKTVCAFQRRLVKAKRRLIAPTSFHFVDCRKARGTVPLARHQSHRTFICVSVAP